MRNPLKRIHDFIVWHLLSIAVTLWAISMMINYAGWLTRHPRSAGPDMGWDIVGALWYDTVLGVCVILSLVTVFCLCVYAAFTYGMMLL